jgi:hypothetical protein
MSPRATPTTTNTNTNTMTTNQLEAALATAGKNRAAYRATNLENGGGYNPYDAEIEQLSEQLSKITAATKSAILSGDSLTAEREWFKAQGFTAANLQAANTACLARGYTLADLQAAAKAAVAA